MGCATLTPPRFNGPGTFQDFANARYQCLQETTARISSAVVNANVGVASASSQQMPSCSAMSACLASKGYYRAQNGRFDSAGISIQCSL